MNEAQVQPAVNRYCLNQGHKYVFPNMWMPLGEADVLSVTESNLVCEFEIKLSKPGYAGEANKPAKMEALKSRAVHYGNSQGIMIPNYFYYVSPKDIITNVPDFAGWLQFNKGSKEIGGGGLVAIKPAPLLHGEKFNNAQIINFLEIISQRYWGMLQKNLALIDETRHTDRLMDYLYTSEEAANYCNVDVNHIRKAYHDGTLKGYKPGGTGNFRFSREQLETWVNS